MTAKQRIAVIRLSDKIDKNKIYAKKIGLSVEMKSKQKRQEQRKESILYE